VARFLGVVTSSWLCYVYTNVLINNWTSPQKCFLYQMSVTQEVYGW